MKKAKQLAFLADTLDAQTALDWGLGNWIVPPGEVEDFTAQIALRLSDSPPASLAHVKRLLNQAPSLTLSEQVANECHALGLCAETPDFVEGVNAFMGKRKAVFRPHSASGSKPV